MCRRLMKQYNHMELEEERYEISVRRTVGRKVNMERLCGNLLRL